MINEIAFHPTKLAKINSKLHLDYFLCRASNYWCTSNIQYLNKETSSYVSAAIIFKINDELK
jgi:hypothetical protein